MAQVAVYTVWIREDKPEGMTEEQDDIWHDVHYEKLTTAFRSIPGFIEHSYQDTYDE